MGRRGRSGGGPDAIVVVDKPAGLTSHDVVARLRRVLGTARVGHAGTLDPMATGVLVVGVERGTRLLGHLSLSDKDYVATVRLGIATTTEDAQGEVVAILDAAAVTDDDIAAAAADLTGEIDQRPSSVSAIKVDGVRAYARVRAGEDVVLATRPVTVSRFDILRISHAAVDDTTVRDVDVAVTVSSGTYVRALARDLGDALGVGGHLTALRRTRVGAFDLADATALAAMEAPDRAAPIRALSAAAAAARVWAVVRVDDDLAVRVGHGNAVPWRELESRLTAGRDSVLDAQARSGAGNPTATATTIARLRAGAAVALVGRDVPAWIGAYEVAEGPALLALSRLERRGDTDVLAPLLVLS